MSTRLPALVWGKPETNSPQHKGFAWLWQHSALPETVAAALNALRQAFNRFPATFGSQPCPPYAALWPVEGGGYLLARLLDAGRDESGRPHTVRIEACYSTEQSLTELLAQLLCCDRWQLHTAECTLQLCDLPPEAEKLQAQCQHMDAGNLHILIGVQPPVHPQAFDLFYPHTLLALADTAAKPSLVIGIPSLPPPPDIPVEPTSPTQRYRWWPGLILGGILLLLALLVVLFGYYYLFLPAETMQPVSPVTASSPKPAPALLVTTMTRSLTASVRQEMDMLCHDQDRCQRLVAQLVQRPLKLADVLMFTDKAQFVHEHLLPLDEEKVLSADTVRLLVSIRNRLLMLYQTLRYSDVSTGVTGLDVLLVQEMQHYPALPIEQAQVHTPFFINSDTQRLQQLQQTVNTTIRNNRTLAELLSGAEAHCADQPGWMRQQWCQYALINPQTPTGQAMKDLLDSLAAVASY